MLKQTRNSSLSDFSRTVADPRQVKMGMEITESSGHDTLAHLVLCSGERALRNMAHHFRSQLREEDLRLFSGRAAKESQNSYRAYELKVCTHLKSRWQGPNRGLKKQVRRSLKPFRKSSGLLMKLLATPARVTAAACLMVLLGGGYRADASMMLSSSSNRDRFLTPAAIKQEVQRREVIFMDTSLPDRELLLSGVSADASVVLLKPSRDLIGQVVEHLLQSGPAESLHLFTHGSPGQLNFGQAVINRETLERQSVRLNLMGTLLTGSRDIFLYGCQVAAGGKGRDFIKLLSKLTQADVAASDDITGATEKGGDWELEMVTGKVNGRAVTAPDYSNILAPGKVIAGDASGGGGGGGGYGYYTPGGDGGAGGAGGGDNDTITGTAGDDILFGDGSGGGGGGGGYSYYYSNGSDGSGGSGGSGNDIIGGGPGNDILFGDGFDGVPGSYVGGTGGFGGGGGGGDGYYIGGNGGIGGGGGGGSDYYYGGNGGHGGGGGGGGGYGIGGAGGGFNAESGVSPANDEGGGGGGGGYPGGTGGQGGTSDDTDPGHGGDGGFGTYTTGGGYGGNGGDDLGGGGGGGGFGGGNGGDGGNYDGYSGSAGITGSEVPVTLIDDAGQTVYNYVKGQTGTLASLPGGAGNDTLNGGPGSDDLFGMGGTNIFVFESNDATSGSDVDTIFDWNNSTTNKIRLQSGEKVLTNTQVTAILSAQTANGADRTIVHANGTNQVTIVVKDIDRDLVISDFEVESGIFFPIKSKNGRTVIIYLE